MSWLMFFIPVAIALEHLAPDRHLAIFVSSGLAILPLAAWMGRATEQIAGRLGEGVGGLLNATFGNAAELIIALAAMREGLYDVVKASIAGSIVGNILLVLSRRFPGKQDYCEDSGGTFKSPMVGMGGCQLRFRKDQFSGAFDRSSGIHLDHDNVIQGCASRSGGATASAHV
jgi:hypothetical protein